MKTEIFRNVVCNEKFDLRDEVNYQTGNVAIKNILLKSEMIMNVMALKKDEKVEPHGASGEVFIYILEGVGEFVIGDKTVVLEAGKSVIMEKNIIHSVRAIEDFKMLLTIAK